MLEIPSPLPPAGLPALRKAPGGCDVCAVRGRSICAALQDDARNLLGRDGRIVTIERGQTLAWEGEESAVVANVVEGALKLATSTSDGREQIVGIALPSDFVGRPFGDRSPYTITALVESRCCLFPRSSFDRFSAEHPELEHRLLESVLDELDRARRWMLLLGRKTAPERIASFILELSDRLGAAECGGSAPLDRFELPLDRQQISDILGLTIETISRQFSALRTAGIVDLPTRRTVHILDRLRLRTRAGN